jgi:hypothetical protein
MVMGQEERKNKAKLEKTQIQLASTSNDYEAAVKALEETTGRWNRDWKAACDVGFLDLQEDRQLISLHRNSKIWKRRDWTLPRAVCGASPTSPQPSVSVMMP